jgi:ABC-type dipeptide/oligopeptide/nickel transport system permease subunit
MPEVSTMLEAQPVTRIAAATREPQVFDLRYLPWGSLLIIMLLVFVALGAPLLTSYSPIEQALPDKLLPPAWEEGGRAEHLLGTDMFGRDMLARLCYGARVSLLVIAASLPVGGGVGLLLGSCPAISVAVSIPC